MLGTTDGHQARIASVRNNRGHEVMHDITVAKIHTYHVLAGNTPILVHNCGTAGDTFRADTRGPDEIFESGFEPRGSNMNLDEHVAGVSGTYTPASGFVSTTTSQSHAISRGGYVYQIRGGPEGIDVNKAIPGNRMSHEREIAVPGKIPTECIVGCRMPDGTFRPNSNFGRRR